MFVKSDFLIGLVVGAVTGVVGYRLYDQYGDQLKSLVLQSSVPVIRTITGGAEPSLEELVAQKERLEDLIAEKNQQSL